jgi:hypothetical protein
MISRLIAVSAFMFIAHSASAVDAMSYAKTIKSHLKSTSVCSNYSAMIDNIAFGGMPDQIKVRQIDKIVDAADRSGCINY